MKTLIFGDGARKDVKINFNGSQVTIYDTEPNVSGFTVMSHGNFLRDASAYKTLYRAFEDYYILSNNGAVYVAPPEPTEEELEQKRLEEEARAKAAEEAAEAARIEAEKAALIPTNEELADAIAELANSIADLEDAIVEIANA